MGGEAGGESWDRSRGERGRGGDNHLKTGVILSSSSASPGSHVKMSLEPLTLPPPFLAASEPGGGVHGTGSGAPVFLSVGAHLISRSSCSSTREKWSAAMIFISPVPTSTTSVPGWSGAAKMATWAARLQGHGLPVDLRCWASPHESGDSPKPLDAV